MREVAEALIGMGCYEVSLGDTVGTGTPASVSEMLEEVKKRVPVEKLAVSHSSWIIISHLTCDISSL